jgi:hypothetical protein
VKEARVYDLATHPKTGRPVRVRYVLYALKSEEWRIPAMFLALETMRKLRVPVHKDGRTDSRSMAT